MTVHTRRVGRVALALFTASTLIASLGVVPSVAGSRAVAGPHGATVTPRLQTKVSAKAIAGKAVRAATKLPTLARPSDLKVGTSTRKSKVAATATSPKIVASPPPFVSSHLMLGANEAMIGGGEPPDPWVAVNGSYVIGSTNGVVSVFNRAGVDLADMPTWALFAMDGFFDSDPRISWDPTHGRWVGVEVGFDAPTFADTFLSVIVSDTADPLGTWSVFQYGYLNELPDYPGIASSSDKIVLTVNEYTDGAPDGFLETSYLVLPWALILNGQPVDAHYQHLTPIGSGTEDFGLRPARPMTATSDLWMVYENGSDLHLHTFKVTGTGSAAVPTGDTDLGVANGQVLAHPPRQPGDADGIVDAVDGRVPDAVWFNGTVLLARTTNFAFDGVNPDLAVEVLSFATANPAGTIDSTIFGSTGTDSFTPGVGMSLDGSRFMTYSSSSASANPSVQAESMPVGFGWTSPITVASSDSTYAGTRWGDFAGIAPDPLGAATVWQEHEISIGGEWQAVISRLIVDGGAPVVSGHPLQSLVTGTTVGGQTIPVRITWPAATDAGSGITAYWLSEANPPFPDWFFVASVAGLSAARHHFWTWAGDPTIPYAYQVEARDDAGFGTAITSATAPATVVFDQTQGGYTWSSGWKTTSGVSSSYVNGKAKYTSKIGASVSFKTTKIQSIGLVTYRSSSRGKAKVYVDGVLRGTITFTSSAVKTHTLVWTRAFSTPGTHTIKIVVTKGRVDIDAFVVIR